MQYNERYILSVCMVAALGGLLFGYDTAVISGAIGFLRTYFQLDATQMGWAASSALLGCIGGVAIAGVLCDRLGRKTVLMLSAILFAVSAIGSAVPKNLTMLVLFRILGGFGVGAVSMTSPLFIAEISPAKWRGRLVSWNQFAIVSGMLIVYFVNYFIANLSNEVWNIQVGWRWMFASELLPAILFLLFLFLVPESPRWLIKKGEEENAKNILNKIGGPKYASTVYGEIKETIAHEEISLKQLFLPGWRIVLIIGVVLAILQQVTGINVFLYYAPEIFKKLGAGTDSALLQTVIVGFVNLSFTIIAIKTVDRLGRKTLMFFGSSGMGLCLLALGFATYFQRAELWILFFILGYIACFAISVGPVTWVILSEIFPTKIRGRAISIATVFLWAANYLISQTFPMLNENPWLVQKFHHGFTFWLYAIMCFVTVIFVQKFLPETKAKSLEEIEKYWQK
jgi:SP family xylose:H+ symportor-like MFS transporter